MNKQTFWNFKISNIFSLKRNLQLFLFLLTGSFFLGSNVYSEFYLEGYGGVLFGPVHLNEIQTKNTYNNDGLNGYFDFTSKKHIHPNFIGGVKIGSWFGKNNPASSLWQNVGCYFDVSSDYLRWSTHDINTSVRYTENSAGPAEGIADTKFSSKGYDVTASFLLSWRYGFLTRPEHPFGILQPYLACGPALVIISQKPSLLIGSHTADGGALFVNLLTQREIEANRKTVWVPALAVDAGLRWLMAKHVFLDAFFKYRFAKADFHIKDTMNFHPTLHLCSCHLGLGYEF